ncbi:NAD(P)H-binding protein [Stigmatella sp. ncwal1]|uniref:NAD(P)H-binding protein n=1 Tax=Stigmatella ashevillensis TaxID=2995309 RepID=A0ABT5DC13_9BACT|nr:NAD(P)H-binding protein [Stigmatella ashevillena]MDC0711154.1 NAD(P)H-binding protein [Stigmatella ashevillena]
MRRPLPEEIRISVTGRGNEVTYGPSRPVVPPQEAELPVLIFGAAGRTGRILVDQAVGLGHRVTAFARDLKNLPAPHARLRLMQGSVEDADAVAAAMKDQTVVLCALGPTGRKDREAIAQGTQNIVTAMREHHVRRLIYMPFHEQGNGWGPSALFEKLMGTLRARKTPEGWQHRVAVIRESPLEWVIVRPTRLTDGPAGKQYQVSIDQSKVPLRISRADVADFMLEQLRSPRFVRKSPVIGG